jgi:hypothetical protein
MRICICVFDAYDIFYLKAVRISPDSFVCDGYLSWNFLVIIIQSINHSIIIQCIRLTFWTNNLYIVLFISFVTLMDSFFIIDRVFDRHLYVELIVDSMLQNCVVIEVDHFLLLYLLSFDIRCIIYRINLRCWIIFQQNLSWRELMKR